MINDAQKKKIIELSKEDLTASQIGEMVGLSRNSVLSFSYRAGFKLKGPSGRKPGKHYPAYDKIKLTPKDRRKSLSIRQPSDGYCDKWGIPKEAFR